MRITRQLWHPNICRVYNHSGYGYAANVVLAVIALYAFRFSLGGRPILAPSRLDE